jgi:hypothetical protein
VAGQIYNFFLVHAKKDTEQTYQMYVGSTPDVKLIRANIANAPFIISSGTGDQTTLITTYDKTSGILTVTLNLSAFEKYFASAAKDLCVPKTFCDWDPNDGKCVGKAGFGNLTPDERNIACSYAGKDIDCPTGGCVGFSVKLPDSFTANDQTTQMGIPSKQAVCFPKGANWSVTREQVPSSLAGVCSKAPMTTDFCS